MILQFVLIFITIFLLAEKPCFPESYFMPAPDPLILYYNINQSKLTSKNKTKLSDFLTREKPENNDTVIISGYTDYLGTPPYNKTLSQKRAENVKNFLSKLHHDHLYFIVEGKGELPPVVKSNPYGIPGNRKVEVTIKRKDHSKKTVLSDLINQTSKGENIILNDLNFLPGQHYLREESLPVLKDLLEILKQHPSLKIEIRGHVCCTDSTNDGYDLDLENFNLSVNRAKYIYDWLLSHGIDSSRLAYIGLARKYPLIPVEVTETDRMKNRRVEIKIFQK